MIGIDRDSGATVDDWLQFVQRATRALTTPLGTRQKRPLYGSLIPTLLGRTSVTTFCFWRRATRLRRFTTRRTGSAIFSRA